jgi:hypothetical protein
VTDTPAAELELSRANISGKAKFLVLKPCLSVPAVPPLPNPPARLPSLNTKHRRALSIQLATDSCSICEVVVARSMAWLGRAKRTLRLDFSQNETPILQGLILEVQPV